MPDQPDITIGVQADAAPQPALPHGERYECPISTCSWTYDAPPAPAVDPATLAHIFGPGVMTVEAVNHYRTKIERVLEDHFNRHPIAEYIAEISSLRNLNIGLIQQMQQLSGFLRREVDPAVLLSLAVGPGLIPGL